MEYLLKSTLICGIIYSFYKIFLQKETFFKSIRLYFVIGTIVSLLLPLVIIPIYREVATSITPPQIIEYATDNIMTITKDEVGIEPIIIHQPFNWIRLIKNIYLLGIVFFVIKFALELFSLTRLIAISKKRKEGKYQHVETNMEMSPFSFFNYIVYNKKQFKKEELKDIIAHEKVHIQQKHTLDILLMHMFVIIQWFNPLVWKYKNEAQQNLEYIADKEAQEKAETHKKYQYLLLKTSSIKNPFALSNNFFNSQLKKRILMLQKRQTKRLNQVKYLLLIPIIGLFLYAFNTKEIIKPIEREPAKLSFVKKGNDVLTKLNKLNTKEDIENIRYKLKENGLELEITNLKYNASNQIKAIRLSIEDKNGNRASAFWEESRNKNGIPLIYIGKYDGKLIISSTIQKKYEELFQNKKDKIKFINPIEEENVIQISSGFGMRKHPILKTNKFHNGIDIKAYKDMDVYATAKGKVIKTAYDKLKGNYIQIKHANNYQTNYHHLGNIQIEEGEQVQAGDIIGIIGNTGASTGIHLHYEIMKDGNTVNPKLYLNYGKINQITIRSKTTNVEIEKFNNQFVDLESKIRIIDIKRNKNNEIKGYKVQTKFNNEEFKNNLSFDASNKVIQVVRIESINNKSSFKITHNFFGKNISIIIDKNGSVSSLELIKTKPATTEINTWKNSKKYGIWIDGKKVKNNRLNDFSAKDFSSYYVSKLAKNASNYGKYYYQVDLMTNTYYANYIKKKRSNFVNKNQYRVKKGDTAYSIAKKFNMSVDELYALNSGLNKNLIVGVYITIRNKEAKEIKRSNAKIIITKSTTNQQFKEYIALFKKENIEIKIYDVKRNNKNEIIAIKIDGKSKNTSSTFSYEQNEPILKVSIFYDKEKDEIYIENIDVKNKRATRGKISHTHTTTHTKVDVEFEEDKEQLKAGIDSFSVIFDKNIAEKEYEKIKEMFKEYGAEISIKDVKRNFLGKITTINIKIQKGDKSAIYIDGTSAHTIVPVEVGVDNKSNNVFIKERKKYKKKERNNTKIAVNVNDTTTDTQIDVYKKLFKDFGVTLKFLEITRNKEGKIKSLKIKSTIKDIKHNNTSFSVSSEKTIIPFKIIYDKNERKVIFKENIDKKNKS